MAQEYKTLTVTRLRSTIGHLCAFLLDYCASDETGRVAAKRTEDSVEWEDGGGFMRENVYSEPSDAFQLVAVPAAVGPGLVRVDFILTNEADDFLRRVVLRELRLTWPDMHVTEDEAVTEQRIEAKRTPSPWDDTTGKINRLYELRREALRDGVRLTWTAACQQAGISPKTARKHASDLRAHWKNTTWRENR